MGEQVDRFGARPVCTESDDKRSGRSLETATRTGTVQPPPDERTTWPRIVVIHRVLPMRRGPSSSAFSMSVAVDRFVAYGRVRGVERFVE